MSVRTHWDNLRSKIEPHMKWVIFLASSIVSVIFLSTLILSQRNWQYPIEVWSLYRGNAQVTQGNIAIVSIDNKTLSSFTTTDLSFLQLGSDQEKAIARTLNILENSGVKNIAIDIIFANNFGKENRENLYPIADVIRKYKNIILAMRSGIGEGARGTDSNTNKTASGNVDCGSYIKTMKKQIISGVEIEVEEGGIMECKETDQGKKISSSDRVHPNDTYDGLPWGFINQSNDAGYSLFRPKWLPDGDDISSIKPYPSLGYGLSTLSGSRQNPDLGVIDRFSYFTKADGTNAYPIYSFIDVYEGRVPKALLAGKTIFIGESGELLHDTVKSPIADKEIPGVETHAHYYESLERGLMIHDIPRSVSIVGMLILILIISACFVFFPGVLLGWGVVILSAILSVFLGRYLLTGYQLIIPIAVILPVIGMNGFFAFLLKYVFIERQKSAIRKAFGRYLDERVVRDIERRGSLDMEGKSVNIAVIFSDIESFSSYAERLGTQKIFILMSLYLSRMTQILQLHGGTLDKYIGDAVMGFIGAPLEMTREEACSKAFAIVNEWQQALPSLNAELKSKGLLTALDGSELPPIRFRAGVSYGPAIVGNIGSEDRLSYTAMGDTVNLAARLEPINKYYGTYLCIAQSAYEGLTEGECGSCMILDRIKVKGKNEGVNIYEILTPESDMNIRTTYKEAMIKYFAHTHNEAKMLLESVEESFGAAKFILRRYREEEYAKRVGDDGTFEFHEK